MEQEILTKRQAGGPHLPVSQDVSGCLQDVVGAEGLSGAEYDEWRAASIQEALKLSEAYDDGSLALLRVVEEREDVEAAQAAYERLIVGAETVIFLGTGGSSLGGQTIAQLGGWYIPGDKGKSSRRLPRTRIFDNLDPRSLELSLKILDLETTRFVVISKSGNTVETLVQAAVVCALFKQAGLEDKIGRSMLGLSEPRVEGVKNGLRDLLEDFGCAFLEHHTGIGGRFSSLTNVGLILAIARGLDPFAIRAGAKAVVDGLRADPADAELLPVDGAAVSIGLLKERGISDVVMMPYANQLARFSAWYVQLWAESLGKDGLGMTPIAALGPVDQHSQLQLFMDGPKDKLITVISTDIEGTGPVVDPALAKKAGMDYMAGRTVGDLVHAQARATVQALRSAGQPTRSLHISELSEFALGQLLMSFMVETILAAGLLGINAFDQPAVEIGKKFARDHLSG